jgi:cytochrome c peroxidase
MKRVGIIAVVVVLCAVALPLSNLFIGAPSASLEKLGDGDTAFKAAAAILAEKCVNCHTVDYQLPFYAKLPVAKGVIEADIKLGLAHLDYVAALAQTPSEVVLAKSEQALLDGSMPPARYLMLHWDGGLGDAEKTALLDWIRQERAARHPNTLAAEAFANDSVQPLPATHSEDPQKVVLGDKLYHDKRLSKDDSLSCAGCHDLAKGGTDQARFSTGVGGALGGINAPTTFNSGLQFLQFWDGRAPDLEAQADGPPNNPIEMATNWPDIIAKLNQDAAFKAEFDAVYPEGFSKETITSAIAVFERTLITPNSGLDKYLMGDENALNEEEKRGYALFKEYKCATCHVGQLMGGQSFETMGLKADYLADRGDTVTDADHGRFNVTKDEGDRGKLKVPTLRNIALTFPYLHDGATSDLKETVKIMAKYQVGRAISSADADAIVALLKQCTGEYKGALL